MSSATFDESRIDSDCHKRDNVNGHSQSQSRKSLIKKDSQFKITTSNCDVLQHLVRPAAMVAVPGVLTEKEDTSETKDNVSTISCTYTKLVKCTYSYTSVWLLDYSYCSQYSYH